MNTIYLPDGRAHTFGERLAEERSPIREYLAADWYLHMQMPLDLLARYYLGEL